MAVVTREYADEQGRALVEYESGAVLDRNTGKIVRPPQHTVINSANASQMRQRRTELAAAKSRAAIVRATNASGLPGVGGLPISVRNSVDAFAEAIGVIWEQGVLNPDARLDHRTKALHEVGLITEMIAPKQAANAPASGIQISIGADVAAQMMAQLMAQAQQRGILDAE